MAVCLETAVNRRVVLEREADGAPWGVDQWLIGFRLGVIPFRLNGLRGASIVRFTARASLRLFSATRENWRKTRRKKGNVTRMVGRRCRNLLIDWLTTLDDFRNCSAGPQALETP